jgi:carlactone synthase / all-trans-10'-apo-beta-carotenal 13,14-cleaving dioxygenase
MDHTMSHRANPINHCKHNLALSAPATSFIRRKGLSTARTPAFFHPTATANAKDTHPAAPPPSTNPTVSEPTWPSEAARAAAYGTTSPQEVEREVAEVSGRLPEWLAGALLRNGPGTYENGTDSGMMHMFDGYAMLLKLDIDGKSNSVVAARKYCQTQAWKHFTSTGNMRWREFGTAVPATGPLGRIADVMSVIAGSMGLTQGVTDNASVNIIPRNDGTVWALTETVSGTIAIDPATLETLGAVRFDDILSGPSDLTTAHPAVLSNGDLINLVSTPGFGFTVYRLEAPPLQRAHGADPTNDSLNGSRNGNASIPAAAPPSRPTLTRKLITKLPHRHPASPAWIHDFCATDNYVIFAEMPCYFNLVSLMTGAPTPFIFMDWKPEEGTLLHVVRLSDGAVSTCRAPPFFVLHWANAWEESAGQGKNLAGNGASSSDNGSKTNVETTTKIHLDAAVYDDPEIVNHLLLDNLRSGPQGSGADLPTSRLRRLTLDMSRGFENITVVQNSPHHTNVISEVWKPLVNDENAYGRYAEFPCINPSVKSKQHRFIWGTAAVRPTTHSQALAKWDVENQTAKVWVEKGGLVNEPLFVPRPGGQSEDEGALLCTVVQADGRTALVVLDGQSHDEVARAVLSQGTLTVGFHGAFLPNMALRERR